MKKHVLLLLLLLRCALLVAQDEGAVVKGLVLRPDGSAVTGAVVQLLESGKVVKTAAGGNFSFTTHAGANTLEVTALGLDRKVLKLELKAGEIKEIVVSLSDVPVELDQVVVTGQFEPGSVRNSVYNVRTISSERIRLRAANNLLQVLNTELGVGFSNDLTLGTTDISLMGMSGQAVKILMDGVPVPDRSAIRESLGQIDINTIERIEIVEGPMSVIYGTDALAGVINIITRKSTAPESLSLTARVLEESAGREYSSFGSKGSHNQNFSLNWNRRGWNLSASATRNNFGGWQGSFTGREHEWHPKDQWLLNSRLGYNRAKLKLGYGINTASETIYSLGAVNVNTNIATDRNYISRRYFHQADAEYLAGDKLSLTAAAALTDYSRRTQTTNLNILNGRRTLSPEEGSQDESLLNSLFFRATAQFRWSDKVSLQPGLEVNRNGARGARILDSPAINEYSFFVSSEVEPVHGVKIRPGLRVISNSVYQAPPVIPSINALIRINPQYDIRVAYARGFRSPAIRELYFSFFDASHSITGNTSLKAEHSDSFNASVTRKNAAFSEVAIEHTLSGFYNVFDNLIAIGVDPVREGVNTYVNIDKFRTKGITFQNSARWKNVKAIAGYSYIGRYNRLSETNTVPRTVWSSEVSANVIYGLPGFNTTINLSYKFNGQRPTYEAVEEGGVTSARLAKTAAFHTADLSLNKNINHMLSVSGGVKNLFDVTRINNTSADTGGAHSTGGAVPVSYGRSFFLGLTMQWNKNLKTNH